MMTLEEMKLAVCEKLPELIDSATGSPCWRPKGMLKPTGLIISRYIHWPTEGLQVCHESEKLLKPGEDIIFMARLYGIAPSLWGQIHATYEQRLEALCRVWWPERFN